MIEASEAAAQFAFGALAVVTGPYSGGHINDSYLLTAGDRRFILQAINPTVFPDADALMANVTRVLHHLEATAMHERSCLRLVPTTAGSWWWTDADGCTWRAYRFVEGTVTMKEVAGPRDAWSAAEGFGRFQAALADLPGGPLVEIILGFHDTPARLARLRAVASADRRGRAAAVQPELRWLLHQTRLAGSLGVAVRRGLATVGVVHGDAKVANVLLDAADGRAVCVVDLDTVMTDVRLVDVGELLRSATCPHPEDHPEPTEMVAEPELVAAVLEGWITGVGSTMAVDERALMPLAGTVLAFETAVRFLTDWLEGDVYYRVLHDEHNLVRARAQLGLTRSFLGRPDVARALEQLS